MERVLSFICAPAAVVALPSIFLTGLTTASSCASPSQTTGGADTSSQRQGVVHLWLAITPLDREDVVLLSNHRQPWPAGYCEAIDTLAVPAPLTGLRPPAPTTKARQQ